MPGQPCAPPQQDSHAASTKEMKIEKGLMRSHSAPQRMCETKISGGIAPMQQETRRKYRSDNCHESVTRVTNYIRQQDVALLRARARGASGSIPGPALNRLWNISNRRTTENRNGRALRCPLPNSTLHRPTPPHNARGLMWKYRTDRFAARIVLAKRHTSTNASDNTLPSILYRAHARGGREQETRSKYRCDNCHESVTRVTNYIRQQDVALLRARARGASGSIPGPALNRLWNISNRRTTENRNGRALRCPLPNSTLHRPTPPHNARGLMWKYRTDRFAARIVLAKRHTSTNASDNTQALGADERSAQAA